MGGEYRATLVITTRNRKEELLGAVASALTQTAPLEIILLDDASDDGTPESIGKAFPSVRLIRAETRQGYIRLRNLGAGLASAPFIFSIDDDAIFTTPRVVEQVLAEFDDPRVGAVAIPFADVKISPKIRQQAPEGAGTYVAPMFIGTAHALRKDIFLRLGGYREFFEHQHEEPDYCIRMLAAGYVVRLGRSDPIHHFTSPKRDLARQQYYTARNNLYLLWCNVPTPQVFWRLLRSTAGNVVFALRSQTLRPTLRGLVDGWRGLAGLGRQRRPVTRKCYWLLQSLRRSPRRLVEIQRMLPDVAPGVGAGQPPGSRDR